MWAERHTQSMHCSTVKPPIKDTPKEDKPPNKGQAESTLVYTLYSRSPLKEDNFSTKDKMAGPRSVLIKRFHCSGVGKEKVGAELTTVEPLYSGHHRWGGGGGGDEILSFVEGWPYLRG